MGKPDVNIPESYTIEELVEGQKEANRFDAINPWGTQTWNDDKTVMTQAINPELQQAFDKNIALANADAPQYTAPWRLQNAGLGMLSTVMDRAGMGSELQGLVDAANPRSRKLQDGPPAAAPSAPASPPGAPTPPSATPEPGVVPGGPPAGPPANVGQLPNEQVNRAPAARRGAM